MGAGPRQDAVGVWTFYDGNGNYGHVMGPCAEHGDLPCTRHASKTWPESRLDVHGSRATLGVIIIGVSIGLYFLFAWLIGAFGMWVAYAPLLAFMGVCASYLLGWGVIACCRLGKK